MDHRVLRFVRLLSAAPTRRRALQLLAGSGLGALAASLMGARLHPQIASAQNNCGQKKIRTQLSDIDQNRRGAVEGIVRQLRSECYAACKAQICPPQGNFQSDCALIGFTPNLIAIKCEKVDKKNKHNDFHRCKTDPNKDQAVCDCSCQLCDGRKHVAFHVASDPKQNEGAALTDLFEKSRKACTDEECQRYECATQTTCQTAAPSEGDTRCFERQNGTHRCFRFVEFCTCGCPHR